MTMKGKQSNEEEEKQQQQEQPPSRSASAAQSPQSDSRKRLLSNPSPLPDSAAASDSSFRRRTRDLPNLYDCHSCKFHVSNIGKDKLQTLTSEWRIVLLCRKCFSRVESAEICSYCFSETSAECFRCSECARRVHRDCFFQCRDVAPWSYTFSDSGFSVCVDCWFPRLLVNARGVSKCRKIGGKGKIVGESCLIGNSRVLENGDVGMKLEAVVKDASSVAEKKIADAARAREKALRKAVVARKAVELASNALELMARRDECGGHVVVDDAELAFQLHRAINSSPRISRNMCLMNSSGLDVSMMRECNGDKVSVGVLDSGNPSVCGKLEACTDNKLFENPDRSLSETSVHVRVSDNDADVDVHNLKPDAVADVRTSMTDSKCKGKCDSGDDKGDMLLKEGEGSCSNKLILSSGGDNSIESESHSCQKQYEFRHELCPSDIGTNGQLKCGEDSATLKDERGSKPDRYLKKYSKRPISLKAVSHRATKFICEGFHLEIQASSPGMPLNCSNASRAFSVASFQSCAVPFPASACASVSSRDQS